MRRQGVLWLVLVVIVGAACGETTAPLPTGFASYTGPLGPDTTQQAPARVKVSGKVLGVSVNLPGVSGDTLAFEPIPRTRLRIMRNVLVEGSATQVLAVELLAGAHGEYTVTGLPGGYYIVYAYPPSGSVWADNWTYLPAMQAEVTADVYLWKKHP